MAGSGNAVPSDLAVDLRANSETIDEVVNSASNTATTRETPTDPSGKTIYTLAGIQDLLVTAIKNAGYVTKQDFNTGETLNNFNEALLWDTADGGDGEYYRWEGALPKVVPAASTPLTTGGIGEGAWIAVGYAALSSALANPNESANRVARMAITADSLKDLASTPKLAGRQYLIKGFYAGTDVGGGIFYWDASRDKADHNGGTIIDPDRIGVWDGTQGDLATLFTVGSGSGCFVREEGIVLSVDWFGAVGDSTANGAVGTDDTLAFEQAKSVAGFTKELVNDPDRTYYLPGGVDLFDTRKITLKGQLRVDTVDTPIILGRASATGQEINQRVDWTNGTIKIEGTQNGKITIGQCDQVYLYCVGATDRYAIAYTDIYLGRCRRWKQECLLNGGSAYINGNNIHGGRIRESIDFVGEYPMNDNNFWGTSLEAVTVNIEQGTFNTWHFCRLEGVCSFTFAGGTFNNKFIQNWANFSRVPFTRTDAASWTITDNGDNNDIIQAEQTYIDYQIPFEVTTAESSKGYNVEHLEKTASYVEIKSSLKTIFDTGRLNLDAPAWFVLESDLDADSLNIIVEVFNTDGTKYTGVDPLICEGSGLSWNTSANHYSFGGAAVDSGSIAIKPKAGFGFFRYFIRTIGGGGTPPIGQRFTFMRVKAIYKKWDKQRVTNIIAGPDEYVSSAAPTFGDFLVRDVIYNVSPTAGGKIGWVCTTGGAAGIDAIFKAFGAIDA